MNKAFKLLASVLLFLFIVISGYSMAVNDYIINTALPNISEAEELQPDSADCIMVLGAKVYGSSLSGILSDRMDVGISLYKQGFAPKLLLSGDHGTDSYDEVSAMKQYAIANGVKEEDIFLDHAGFSTYESVYRAKEIFEVNSIIIVTQKYHLYRALYNAKVLGLDAAGVASDLHTYSNQAQQSIREFIARNKDFLFCALNVSPKFLGETIPISGNGVVTH